METLSLKIVEVNYISLAHIIHDHSPSLLGINTSNKMGRVELVLCAQKISCPNLQIQY
jgi:hypothetical protein